MRISLGFNNSKVLSHCGYYNKVESFNIKKKQSFCKLIIIKTNKKLFICKKAHAQEELFIYKLFYF